MEDLQIHSSGVLVDEAGPPIEKFTFSFDGSYLGATCRASNYIWVFNLKNEFPLEHLFKITADNIVTSVAISSNFVCAGFIDGRIELYDLKNIQLKKTLKEPDGNFDPYVVVNSVKFSPDGTKILSGFGDGFVRLFHITENQEPPFLYEQEYDLAITSVLFSNDGNDFYTSSADGNIYITNSMSFEETGIIDTPGGSSFSTLCMSPDSNYIYAICTDYELHSDVYLFDIKQNYKYIQLDELDGYVSSVSTDGKYICSCSLREGLLFYQVKPEDFDHWAMEDRKTKMKQVKKNADIISCCAYSPDGRYLILGGKKITINLNPMAYWTPDGHDELFKTNQTSSVKKNIMAFFLSNDYFKTKVPLMINIRIFGHLTYFDLLRNNPKFISYNQ